MNLLDVYETPGAVDVLYQLLRERTPEQSISHKRMPTYEQHRKFVFSRPYPFWYLIEAGGYSVGATYLTHRNEIGIFILRAAQGRGYGSKAVRELMLRHPGPFLANISPENEPSMAFFERLGFNLLQMTYAK